MKEALRIVRLAQIAILVGVVVFVFAGEFAGVRLTVDAKVLYAIPFASISLIGAILVVRKTLVLQSETELRAKPGDAVALARWKSGYIVTYVLCEALALFGLLLRIMGSSRSQVWPYYAGGIVLILLFWPRLPSSKSN
jgi:mannose/fructose/N-acetylgalactosamine-specific phosphotransferase system component IIC